MGRPDRWHEWAHHLRSLGFGPGEVGPGRLGIILMRGVLPALAVTGDVVPGYSWSWRVGLIRVDHLVEEEDGGSLITIALDAPLPVLAALQALYGPTVETALERLSRLAAR